MKNRLSYNLVNTFWLLVIQFFLLLILYTVLRAGFYTYNKSLFPSVETDDFFRMLWGGVKFDVVALLYLNMLYILMQGIPLLFKYTRSYQKAAQWLFIITNSLGVALNLVDYAYYPFTLKRTTGTVFSQFANEDNLTKLAFDFVWGYWGLVLLFVALIFVIRAVARIVIVYRPVKLSIPFYTAHAMLFLMIAFLFVGGVRGGWAHSTRPITLNNAGDYVHSPEEMNIVLNTPFSILKTLKAVQFKEVHYYSEEELEQIYPVIHRPSDTAVFKKANVVILILESFAKEHIGALNKDIQGGNYKGYTPFLDSLIADSYTFSRTFANGRKSIDALPSIITGIPSIGEPFVLSIYSGNKTTSMAKLLGEEGYETAFFHGAPNGSMGFSAYMRLAGVQHYFGKDEYNNNKDFDGMWGIWDEPFMQFMAKELNNLQQPFFAGFFSLSSHHPFRVPIQYEGKFPKGPLPVQEPVGYADYALRQFFQTASKMPWFDNTLFVICADHATVSHLPEYKTSANSVAIPIVFYHPSNKNLRGVSDKLVQQIDIMPTVMNYLGYDKPYFSFGFDAFADNSSNFSVNNISGTYCFFQGDYFMTHNGEKPLSLFNLRVDRLEQEDVLAEEAQVADSLERNLKAFIQQYNNRMIHNNLVAP
ncbi:LTA synthase family protein [Sphingobacterium haloxyli]|uniref:Sulfatase n=1 Tax=Sphingobacterium haloxyli TaxID=2100533 RepID=A0A2S9J6J2_9SPHI|nr:alkaline phosphatase family protein [Sphingobacterium haloxyli]PRD48405.1 sulfatase [Sphingobacterium haloxyli]